MDDDLVWRAVSPERPCPVCGAVSGCGITDGDGFTACRSVPSEHPLDVGGWLHPAPAPTRRRQVNPTG
jgi:hypothetical protein